MTDPQTIASKLTSQHVAELRRVLPEDDGYLARGDPSNLTGAGLATAPMGQGYYRLNAAGLSVRTHMEKEPK